MSHNKTNMSQRAQGPKTKNEKTERREGEKGKKEKNSTKWFRFRIGASERQDRENESLRDLSMERRRSYFRGSMTARLELSRDFESERLRASPTGELNTKSSLL